MEKESIFVKKVTHIIQTNLSNPKLNGAFLAQYLNISRMQVHRKLKQDMRLHASGLILQIRIEHAKNLLSTTTIKIANVAKACGYSDYRYFSKVFKNSVGCTPSQYRDR